MICKVMAARSTFLLVHPPSLERLGTQRQQIDEITPNEDYEPWGAAALSPWTPPSASDLTAWAPNSGV